MQPPNPNRYWRLRAWLHQRTRGHKPDYYTSRGVLGGLHVYCHRCLNESLRREAQHDKELNQQLTKLR